MTVPKGKNDEKTSSTDVVALFRYGVIADVLHLDPKTRQLSARLREKAELDYSIPGSLRRHVAAETMRGWLKAYRRGGFDALRSRPRSDRGVSRAIDATVSDLLCAIKDESPGLTVPQVIGVARERGISRDVSLAPSTVHRLLSRQGLMDQRPPGSGDSKDRRRFAFESANQLWMSDVMHGPAVVIDGRRRHRTYLIAFIDDATRVVTFAAFAFSENVATFLPALEQAIRRRGIPERLYVDNGSAFRSQHVALVCAKLGITLIHARPYQPQGKGKMERWFRTVRMQFLARLTEADLQSLTVFNRRFWAWVEGEYHQSPHKGLDGQTPFDRWAVCATSVRTADADLGECFLFEQRRRVQKDRTVSLLGVAYEVDASLVGETVTLRYDPARVGAPIEVTFQGRSFKGVRPVDVYANCHVRRDHGTKQLAPDSPPPTPRSGIRMSDIKREDS
jgi:transposase InsO family protein